MIKSVEEFHSEFVNAVEEGERLCFAPRAKELQFECASKLEELKGTATQLKAQMILLQEEDLANRMLSYEEALNALSNELHMWVALKEDRADSAWDFFVRAESSARISLRAHDISSHLTAYLKRLQVLERLIFPPMTFMSVGVLVRRSSCSICGEEYGDCNHVKGIVYMGELCAREIHEADILEASIVERPANKHCRITSFTENGLTRDTLTWRILDQKDDGENREAEAILHTP